MIHNPELFPLGSTFGPGSWQWSRRARTARGDFEVAQMLQHQGRRLPRRGVRRRGVLLRERGSMPVVVLRNCRRRQFRPDDRQPPRTRYTVSVRSPISPMRCRMRAKPAIRFTSSSIRACTGWDSWRGRLGGCAGAADIAAVKVASVFFAPELRRHARRGCLHPGADRALRPHERRRSRVAAIPSSAIRQFGGHRAVPRGAVRHVPPRAGALRLRLGAQCGPAPGFGAQTRIVQIKVSKRATPWDTGAPGNCCGRR